MSRVVLGMSGGVDSSVAAILLQKQGYEVIGITFEFVEGFDATDASNVCKKLGIEHHIIDYKKEFKKLIIDEFINDYKKGITPNPCVYCNKYVKLKFLYEQMKKFKCDFIATGHYARVKDNKLYRSADLNKDQSYFLSEVPFEIISKTIFPLEGIDKDKVREIAFENNLEVANKKDSFDVCFINTKFKDFMEHNIDLKKGNVIDIHSGNIIGKHNGLSFYTIGQRRGLNIGGMSSRLFVVGKDKFKNVLYVSNDESYLISDECIINNVNLISYHHPTFCTAKFRYRSKEIPVSVEYMENNKIRVKYENGCSSVTPGQTCALYLGEECIGGGIIDEIRKNNKKIWYL